MGTVLPAVVVEVGFAASPSDVLLGNAITWTDITAKVRMSDGLTMTRGRSGQDAQVSAGQLSLTLNNEDGRFTPLNPSSPYGSFSIRVPIRVRTQVNTTWVTLWTGTVDDWGTAWTGGIRGRSQVTASDMTARVARKDCPSLPLASALASAPSWCYAFDEASGANPSDRTGNPLALPLEKRSTGSPTSATADTGLGFGPGAVNPSFQSETTALVMQPQSATIGYYYENNGGNTLIVGSTGSGTSLHAMVLPTLLTRQMTAVSGHGFLATYAALGVSSSGKAQARVVSPFESVDVTLTDGGAALSTSAYTHLALTMQVVSGSLRVSLWNNGTEVAFTTLSRTQSYQYSRLWVGGGNNYLTAGNLWQGSLANVCAHASVLTATQIADLAGGRDGWTGDGSVARFYRIARYLGLSSETAPADTGSTTMSSQYAGGGSAADAFGQCADAELAPWWVTAEGKVRMRSRATRYAASLAFPLSARSANPDLTFTCNDQFLTNRVTLSRPGGTEVTRTSAASVAKYETYADARTLWVETDDALIYLAEGLATHNDTPKPRCDSVSVDVTSKQALIGAADRLAIAQADVGSLFSITALPPLSAPAVTVYFFAEGISDTFDASGWVRRFNTSPAEDGLGWALGTSALGTDTRIRI